MHYGYYRTLYIVDAITTTAQLGECQIMVTDFFENDVVSC